MKLIRLVLIGSILLGGMISCKNGADSKNSTSDDSYEKTKESLEEKEKKNPIRFLAISGKDKHNLIGQTVIKGTITNKARIATYKDVEIELSFFSKTGVLLEKEKETIFEELAPGETTDFKTKYFAPKGTDSVALKIVQAKTEE